MKVLLFGSTGMIGQGVMRECLLDLRDLSSIESELAAVDACFLCLGVSSAGRSEEEYAGRTGDDVCLRFRHGADGSEQGRTMWARVKGRTENALLRLPFRAA